MTTSDSQLYALLFAAYMEARKNERISRSQVRFEENVELNILKLRNELSARTYHPTPPECFIIRDPVQREVFAPAFRDRIISHLYCMMTQQMFERTFIEDSYSCHKGKGTFYGIDRAASMVRASTNNFTRPSYVLTIDISGYFMNINREKLYSIILGTMDKYQNRRIHPSDSSDNSVWNDVIDFDLMKFISDRFLHRDPCQDCVIRGSVRDWDGLPDNKSLFKSPDGVGLTIGDLQSQLSSNIYLNVFDQFIKRTLKAQYYGRYVDDAFIISQDKNYLLSIIPRIEQFLNEELGLKLNRNKTKVLDVYNDFRFLGGMMHKGRLYVRNRSVGHFHGAMDSIEKVLHRFKDNPSHIKEILSVNLPIINSYLGYLSHFRSFKIRRAVCRRSIFQNYFVFSPRYERARIIKGYEYSLSTSESL